MLVTGSVENPSSSSLHKNLQITKPRHQSQQAIFLIFGNIFYSRHKSYSSPYLTEYIRVLSWNPLSLLYSDANHIRLADMKCPLGKWRFLHLVCFNRFFYFPLKNSDTSWFANRVYQSSPPQTMFILLCFFSDLFEK